MNAEATERLTAWLSAAAGGAVTIREMSLLSGGAIQENWRVLLDVADGEWKGSPDLVLRKDAPSGVAVSHGRAAEFHILKLAHKGGVLVPTPCVLCEDTSVLGSPFFLMHRVPGASLRQPLTKGPLNEELVADLGRNLARIHAIQGAEALTFLESPQPTPTAASIADYRRHLDEFPEAHPALEWGLAWLEKNAPATQTVTFCHRDFRTGNYLVEDGKLTAILDWEFAGLSDPMEDIGWFTAKCWRFGGGVEREAGGAGSLDAFIKGYKEVSGKTVDRAAIPYWQVMGHMRWAVIALQQADRFVTGGERNLELALTGHIVPELELEILRMTAPDGGRAGVDAGELRARYRPSPSLAALLNIARETLRNDVAKGLSGEAKYKALMAANAMAIVGRQIDGLGLDTAAGSDVRRDLAARIRAGKAGLTPDVFAELIISVEATLAESNPRALER